jgi:aspartyl-tRNA(Asn)/glutamyl-tRNA(Gln) amidotransferase subunit C
MDTTSRPHIDIDRVARLARLALTGDELERFGQQLDDVLAYIAALDELDTSAVEPTSHPLPLATPFRDDEVGAALPHEAALANAPETDGEAFVVPKVL